MYSTTATSIRPSIARGFVAVVVAAAVAIALDAAIAAIAHAAGVSHEFKPLEFSSYTSLTVLGIVVAALAWGFVRARSARPRSVFGILVPAVILVSLVPDLVLGISSAMAHTTWGGVLALMAMHIAVAATAVTAFGIGMPVKPV